MGMIPIGRSLVLCNIVTSPLVKSQVSDIALANAIQAKLATAGISLGGQPAEMTSPLIVRTVESRLTIGWTRDETSVSIYVNLTAPVPSLNISNMVSESWNTVSTANHPRTTWEGLSDGVTTERPLGKDQCPPGSVFEVGTREATLAFTAGTLGVVSEWLYSVSPAEEHFYQVQTRHAPQPANGQVLRATVGIVDSITTSSVIDSNIPAMVGTNTYEHQMPTAADVGNAAHAAGAAVARTAAEVVGGALGMGSGDIKFVMYASLGIVGALVLVKVLKEVKAI